MDASVLDQCGPQIKLTWMVEFLVLDSHLFQASISICSHNEKNLYWTVLVDIVQLANNKLPKEKSNVISAFYLI